MKIIEEYVSVACNRTPEIVDWNNDFICFGACNAVAICDTKAKQNLITLTHHTSKVNSVKWLRKSDNSSKEFVSCSADKTAAVWSYKDGNWRVTSELIGHSDGVTCITGLYKKNNDLLIFTGSIDSTVRIWERKNDVTLLKQVLNLNSGLCLTLHAHLLPMVQEPILFCALDDYKIHLFTGDEFHQVHVLVGHEDWVRGLDAMNADESAIVVASASQDTYIRLWRIQIHQEDQIVAGVKVEEKVFQSYGIKWSVKIDAVLAGHEGWVYGVQWYPHQINEGSANQKTVYRLLSSSLDKTLIIWEPQDTAGDNGDGRGVWTEKVRVGEVGGNGLGFYGSCFGPNGKSILGHGYNGSLHIWSHNKETDQWQPSVVPGGHFNSVEDVRWEPTGRYLLSVSTDQTTRLHAPWNRKDGTTSWHELARPQVHGYDMSSIAPISSLAFASSAEEKVIRAFRAPHNFVTNFENVVGEKLQDDMNGSVAEGATVPSLGLSNKAVALYGDDSRADLEDDTDGYFVPLHLTEPPTEDNLIQNTLWPETHKLYGHGNEVIALDASSDGKLLASAAKATNLSLAAIILWETKNFEEIQRLESHQLTVTQICFSPDSKRLLSVSRDRRWTVYHRREGSDLFDVAAASDKTNGVHSRIIWCCAWDCDGALFGTGSRDGKVCIWTKTDVIRETSLKNYALVNKHLDTKTSVTAIAFAPFSIDGAKVVVLGFETGILRIYSFGEDWELLKELSNSAAHHLTVKKLSFRPNSKQTNEHKLASCGSDNIVRIYSVTLS